MAANRNGTSPGKVPQFEGKAQVSVKLPEQPMDHGAEWSAAQKMFSSLATEVGGFADSAAKREGETAGIVAGQAAAEGSAPLALRHDGTIRGDATDKAAIETFSWQYAAKLRTDIGALYDTTKDDPEAFKAGLEKIRNEAHASPVLKDVLGDPASGPKVRDLLDRTITTAVTPYERSVATRQQGRVDEARTTSIEQGVTATRGEIERKAYIAGSDPVSGATLDEEVRKASATIDGAVADGVYSAAEGEQRKKALRESVIVSRIDGTFDALPDPEAQGKFAAGVTQRWASNDPAFEGLDRAKIDHLIGRLHARARTAAADQRVDVALGRQDLKHRLDADIASLRATGMPYSEGGDLDPAMVTKIVGAAAAAEWIDKRNEAMNYHVATADLGRLPAEEIAARVAEVVPQPGAADFDRRKKLADQVDREAARILKLRASDPARAVEEATPKIAAAKAALDPANPESYMKLAAMRLSVQAAIGIPPAARQPLTDAEARAIMVPVTKAAPGQEFQAWQALAPEIAARYGQHAPEVTRQLLQVHGVDRQTATAGAALMASLARGRPDRGAARAVDVHGEVDQAKKAMTPQAAPQFSRPVPARAIEMLKADPSLAATFDEKYGAGASTIYLPTPDGVDRRAAAAAGTTTLAPDGTEGWTP